MAVEGVDYAFPPHPSIPGLAAAGKQFACRYGGWQDKGPGTADKWLTPSEAAKLAAAGLWVCANAEGSASGLLNGYSTGFSWARNADLGFRACGMPADRPIYLSVDFDVTAEQWLRVRDALHGAADALGGVERVGVYGGYRAVEWAHRDRVAAWLWQTYGWSTWRDADGVTRLHWADNVHMQQYRNGVIVAGADVDLNRALPQDYGQWMPGKGPDMQQTDKLIFPTGNPGRTVGDHFGDLQNLRNVMWGEGLPPAVNPPKPDSPLMQLLGMPAELAAIKEAIDALPQGNIDYARLVAELVPVLVPALVQAMPTEPAAEEIAEAVLDEDHRRSAE